VRGRIRGALGVERETRDASGLAEFVDQFVVYVTAVTAEMRERAASEIDAEIGVLADACWAMDQSTRLAIAHERLLDDGEGADVDAPIDEGWSLNRAAREHHAQVMRRTALDPVTTELVRLRCAHHHVCGT
jgi:hypothetical protein